MSLANRPEQESVWANDPVYLNKEANMAIVKGLLKVVEASLKGDGHEESE
jgi:hypothetical protein